MHNAKDIFIQTMKTNFFSLTLLLILSMIHYRLIPDKDSTELKSCSGEITINSLAGLFSGTSTLQMKDGTGRIYITGSINQNESVRKFVYFHYNKIGKSYILKSYNIINKLPEQNNLDTEIDKMLPPFFIVPNNSIGITIKHNSDGALISMSNMPVFYCHKS